MSIFSVLASNAAALSQRASARLPDGDFLVRVTSTANTAPNALRQGKVIEFQALTGPENVVNGIFCSVPKPTGAGTGPSVRELAEFVAACEGVTVSDLAPADPVTGQPDLRTLAAKIDAAFGAQGPGPYVDRQILVSALTVTTNTGNAFVRHTWRKYDETTAQALRASSGGPAVTLPSRQGPRPGAPQPYQGRAGAPQPYQSPSHPYGAPQPYQSPSHPYGAPPSAPPAPRAPAPMPPSPMPPSPMPPVLAWAPSSAYPGWEFSEGPDGAPGTVYREIATGRTVRA